jgi:hypothetical protein
MNKANTGGPAFPMQAYTDPWWGERIYAEDGMTLRDYFAAKAMPMIAAEVYSWKERIDKPIAEITAKMAYEFADAMMKAREA